MLHIKIRELIQFPRNAYVTLKKECVLPAKKLNLIIRFL